MNKLDRVKLDRLIKHARRDMRDALKGFDAPKADKDYIVRSATDLDDIPEADQDPDVNFIYGFLAGTLAAQRAIENA